MVLNDVVTPIAQLMVLIDETDSDKQEIKLHKRQQTNHQYKYNYTIILNCQPSMPL